MARVVFMMLDGAGVGALPDAADYGDMGSDTLGNLSRVVQLSLPNFRRLGLGNIAPLIGVPPAEEPLCLVGRLAPLSAGKDTTVGHWEHMGLVTPEPFPTYPRGFPEVIVNAFARMIGRGVLGNRTASGTAIIAELGREHLVTGRPIVYTSADSVFQIAAHVDVVPLHQLYAWCEMARELLRGSHAVARVIARPFTGSPGSFVRTADRRDFSLAPTGPTYLDALSEAGIPVLALGKIADIFVDRGVTTKLKVATNGDNLDLVTDLLRGRSSRAVFTEGLLLTNLVDFDMVWGHRNDADGFARGLAVVDRALPEVLGSLGPGDRLILTADHGVDPTTPSTDHSREYVPLLLYPRPTGAPQAAYEGTFADSGATAYKHLAGRRPGLHGDAVDRLVPSRGWRRYTPVQVLRETPRFALPCRVGPGEAQAAARWLEESLGPPPDAAVVLGSGLTPLLSGPAPAELPYASVPGWVSAGVPGHPQSLGVARWLGWRVALLRGRIHYYEGYDLSELQLQVRSLAAWGVKRLVLTTASGATAEDLSAGDVLVADEVLDLLYRQSSGAPARLPATGADVLQSFDAGRSESLRLARGIHACVPGPQYETAAELGVLRSMGAATVSMSCAAELRAATEAHLQTAVLAVVANAGHTDHLQVLAATAHAQESLTAAVEAVLSAWGAAGSATIASLY